MLYNMRTQCEHITYSCGLQVRFHPFRVVLMPICTANDCMATSGSRHGSNPGFCEQSDSSCKVSSVVEVKVGFPHVLLFSNITPFELMNTWLYTLMDVCIHEQAFMH